MANTGAQAGLRAALSALARVGRITHSSRDLGSDGTATPNSYVSSLPLWGRVWRRAEAQKQRGPEVRPCALAHQGSWNPPNTPSPRGGTGHLPLCREQTRPGLALMEMAGIAG